MSVVRGRPPGLAGGIRGTSRAYCSSLSACPAPKSPTKARFSAVHMACLQEGLLPSLNRRHGHYASSSVSTARASQTASKLAHPDRGWACGGCERFRRPRRHRPQIERELAAFREGLKETGYVEGQNVAIENRR